MSPTLNRAPPSGGAMLLRLMAAWGQANYFLMPPVTPTVAEAYPMA